MRASGRRERRTRLALRAVAAARQDPAAPRGGVRREPALRAAAAEPPVERARRRAVRALAAAVARGARRLARRADAFRAAAPGTVADKPRGASAPRCRGRPAGRRVDARRTQRGLGRWRRGAARLRRRRRLRTHGRRAFHRWAKLIRYARRLRAARVFGVLKRAAQRRRRRELVVANAYRRARLRLVLGAWVPVAATWKARRLAYAREALYSMTRHVGAVFARQWCEAALGDLRGRGTSLAGAAAVEICQCVGCTFLGDDAAAAPSGGETGTLTLSSRRRGPMASRSTRRSARTP